VRAQAFSQSRSPPLAGHATSRPVNQPERTAQDSTLSDTQLKALVTLLGDEDAAVVETVRGRLKAAGPRALDFLRSQRIHPDPAVRRRVVEMLNAHDGDRFDSEFLAFILNHGEHFDLEEAVWKFTQASHPDINVLAFRAQLDEWGCRVIEKLRYAASGETALRAINTVLFDELGFRGNEQDYYNPANSYLDRVMDRRLGIPISLSVLYMFLARRVRLPVVGIGMPGHFLSRYQTPTEEFYIDAFHGGKLLSRIDCKKRLVELAVEYDERHLAPISPRRVLQRMIANLHLIHKERKHRPEAERLERYLVALAR
jgi:regulator of sirC expression with transglutaminase-like and TPR domain